MYSVLLGDIQMTHDHVSKYNTLVFTVIYIYIYIYISVLTETTKDGRFTRPNYNVRDERYGREEKRQDNGGRYDGEDNGGRYSG